MLLSQRGREWRGREGEENGGEGRRGAEGRGEAERVALLHGCASLSPGE